MLDIILLIVALFLTAVCVMKTISFRKKVRVIKELVAKYRREQSSSASEPPVYVGH